MATFIDLNRSSYLSLASNKRSLDYLSAKYLNMSFALAAERTFIVTSANIANSPGLAYQIYGDRNYWWVICMYNGILDPMQDLQPGTVLQIPSITSVNAFLTREIVQERKVVI
jgi:hypothetical protein